MAERLVEVPPRVEEHGEIVFGAGGDGGLTIKITHVPAVAYQLGCGAGRSRAKASFMMQDSSLAWVCGAASSSRKVTMSSAATAAFSWSITWSGVLKRGSGYREW